MPKLYFFDTGLAASLLGIEKASQLETHPLKGAFFETLIVSELMKNRYNNGLPSNVFFWRDKTGNEVDVIVERGSELVPIEIKSGKTLSSDSYKGLSYWTQLSHQKTTSSYLIYTGKEQFTHQTTKVLNWRNVTAIQNA